MILPPLCAISRKSSVRAAGAGDSVGSKLVICCLGCLASVIRNTRNIDSCGSPPTMLAPLLHDEPSALLVAKIKFRHSSRFGRLLVRRRSGRGVWPGLLEVRDARAP